MGQIPFLRRQQARLALNLIADLDPGLGTRVYFFASILPTDLNDLLNVVDFTADTNFTKCS